MRVGGREPGVEAAAAPEAFSREGIEAILRTRLIGRPLHVLAEVGSTNDVAMSLAANGAAEGTAVLADRQVRGKGRLGRGWDSPAGVGIWTSVILRPPIPPARAPVLTLVAGLATAEAIARTAGLTPELKWPNDVLVAGRKVAGILSELSADPVRVHHVVVGIGVNVRQTPGDFPEGIREAATSLSLAAGRPVARLPVAAGLYLALEAAYDAFRAGQMEALLGRYRAWCQTLGGSVVVQSGGEVLEGRARDVDGEGALLLERPDGSVRRVLTGHVTLRKEEPASGRGSGAGP